MLYKWKPKNQNFKKGKERGKNEGLMLQEKKKKELRVNKLKATQENQWN